MPLKIWVKVVSTDTVLACKGSVLAKSAKQQHALAISLAPDSVLVLKSSAEDIEETQRVDNVNKRTCITKPSNSDIV